MKVKKMGNSRTSRYADGKDLYGADAEVQQILRALAKRVRGAHPETSPVRMPQAILAAARAAPLPVPASTRRVGGEAVRLLLDPLNGPKVRRISRRHGFDEGDVARLWARTRFSGDPPRRVLPVALEEPA